MGESHGGCEDTERPWHVGGHGDMLGGQRSTGGWGHKEVGMEENRGGSGRCEGSQGLWKDTGRIGGPQGHEGWGPGRDVGTRRDAGPHGRRAPTILLPVPH